MAFPGVIISTFLFALTSSYLLINLDWNLRKGLILGSILSATDPVAVVSTLHSLGAGKKITLLIEGESLLNDGSAIVIFHIIIDQLNILDGSIKFILLALGGIAFGSVVAIIVFYILRKVNSFVSEINVIIISI